MSVAGRAALSAVLLVLAVAPVAALADRGKGHGSGPPEPSAHHSLREAVTDQNFYFVMADRFENGDTKNDNGFLTPGKDEGESGFDPTAKGWYHGGDLEGLRSRLRYIKALGTTALWLTPSFKNKAVQAADKSAGYHGYWITDFTKIDPHLGTNDELAALVRDAHRLGIKVYFDIITNHTADVIGYGDAQRRPYVSKDAAPYRRADGVAFDDRDFAGTSFFPALAPAVSFPYTPTVAATEPRKVPEWLNDLTLYHNRGDTTFVGENSQYGDFFGLDDLFTEHPRVVDGVIDI
jgi:alpha-amylase